MVGGKKAGFMARSQRVSNARFKAATGWSPRVPSARDGWKLVTEALHQPQGS